MDFIQSQTRENLLRAFAGESQARNRYLFSAAVAKKQKLHVIEVLFNYTADQERAHAKIFYNHLKQVSGSNITIEAAYPVDNYDEVLKLLRAAQHNEQEEFEVEYAKFARIAKEEGFPAIAYSFEMIGEIEKTHSDRFGRFADLIEGNKLFINEEKTEWLCLNCGHIHHANEAPGACQVCQHPQGFFIRNDLYPFPG